MESAFPKSTCQYFVLSISHIPISIGCFSFSFFFLYLTSAPPLNQLWELGSQPLCWCCHWFMRFSVPAKNLQFSLDLPPVSEPWTQSTWRKKENECYFKYRKNFAKSTSRVAKSTKAPLVVHILRACLLEGGAGDAWRCSKCKFVGIHSCCLGLFTVSVAASYPFLVCLFHFPFYFQLFCLFFFMELCFIIALALCGSVSSGFGFTGCKDFLNTPKRKWIWARSGCITKPCTDLSWLCCMSKENKSTSIRFHTEILNADECIQFKFFSNWLFDWYF